MPLSTAPSHLAINQRKTSESRDKLIENLQAYLRDLRTKNPGTKGLPCLSPQEAKVIGDTLIQIRQLTGWGHFSGLLPVIGLSQPEACMYRRIARDWDQVVSLKIAHLSAGTVYQRLVSKSKIDV